MDINSLLSPQGSASPKQISAPAPAPLAQTVPVPSTNPAPGSSMPSPKVRRNIVGSSQVINSSPLAQSTLPPQHPQLQNLPPPNLPAHVFTPQASTTRASPGKSPVIGSNNITPPSEVPPSRVSSTPSMDALADLASMQNHQPPRSAAPILRRNTESFESMGSPSTMHPNVQTGHLTPRPSIDMAMAEAAKPAMRTDFFRTSLTPERQQRASALTTHLVENPYAYESHAELVKLLHDAFTDHVYPPDSPNSNGDPHAFDLLPELRSARDNMDKLFAIGEELWSEWIQDESMLARSLDERVVVMEKCQKAIEEEYGSTKLWLTYGDWMMYSYKLVHDPSTPGSNPEMSEEICMVGREIFSWQTVLETWSTAAQETAWRINDSHLVWNRYLDILAQDLSRSPSSECISKLRTTFENRLFTPHAEWDETFQLFSNFISTYMNDQYESIMATTTRKASQGKATLSQREEFEFQLSKAQQSGDRAIEYALWTQYHEWDSTPARKKHTSFDLTNALFERAELRFPSDPALWEDHIVLLLDAKKSPLTLLIRATRHCPWSGSLWAQYLLTSEREARPFDETEEVKHKATTTGLLDVSSIEEVVKVHTAWCSFLRRRAFSPDASDEDLDVAEMGIRSSIETLQELGVKKYGKDYQGDPDFRLERIYIKFLSDSGSWDSARETFRGLVKTRGGSWEFWTRWYMWEMLCWAKFVQGAKGSGEDATGTQAPHYATSVLKQGMESSTIDWPERLIQTYVVHCQDHEDAETLQSAFAHARNAQKKVDQRRQKEAAATQAEIEAAKAQAPAVVSEMETSGEAGFTEVPNGTQAGKRKREEEIQVEHEPSKKTRSSSEDVAMVEAPQNIKEKQLKRDRENSTILVENLPGNVPDVKVRQYFRDCGVINTLKVLRHSADEATAVIEFEDHDAALAAQTRSRKDFDGHTIHIQLGSGSTIFVSNFPPEADEAYIKNLFNRFGEILDIRFPSLKYNTHRRFCYVQFTVNSQAQAATELDGMEVNDNLKLVAKISNPLNKQDRSGALEEGREIYVRNIDWSLSEDDLGLVFKKYGTVESVRIPRGVGGKSKGFGYVVFSSKDEASAALDMDEQPVKNRPIHVEMSSKTGPKRQAVNIINRVDRTKSPSVDRNGDSARSPTDTGLSSKADRQARTLALMNIPDTVNDARIRSLTEPYGALVKIVLRPDHQGAIIEYVDTSDAGKASLRLDGYEIAPGRSIHVGTVPEMLKQKEDRHTDKILVGRQKENMAGSSIMMNPGPIRRPGQGSRRGGLGMKRGGAFLGGANSGPKSDKLPEGTLNGTNVAGKSNDDFRAMMEKSSS